MSSIAREVVKLSKHNFFRISPVSGVARFGLGDALAVKSIQWRGFYGPGFHLSTRTFSTEPKMVVKEYRDRSKEDLDGVFLVPHFRDGGNLVESEHEADLRLPHPIWTKEELENQVSPHHPPRGLVDRAAYTTVMTLRKAFDLFTGTSAFITDLKYVAQRSILFSSILS